MFNRLDRLDSRTRSGWGGMFLYVSSIRICSGVEDRFRILRHLGHGSFTEAYLAEDVMGERKAQVG